MQPPALLLRKKPFFVPFPTSSKSYESISSNKCNEKEHGDLPHPKRGLTQVKAHPYSHWKKLKLLISGLVRFKRQDAVSLNDPDQILAQIRRIKRRKSEKLKHSNIKLASDARDKGASPTRLEVHRFLNKLPEAESFDLDTKAVK